MRTKIDYGIDLGTTNSAIARMDSGEVVIKKSDVQMDTMPSCVHFNKKGSSIVGTPAYNILKNDSARALKNFNALDSSTFVEFKRTMGTNHKYKCTNLGTDLSPEDLSKEVLIKLKSFVTDENVNSIVITVPAQFLNNQKEATIQAGKLAGFSHVELLQEPVAAATAYGLSNAKNGYWLVFDFGGGTFDAAIVHSEDGMLSVKDTHGDNWLGGKNLDEAILDQLLIPQLQSKYSIEHVLGDKGKKEILRNSLKYFAEEAKIQLSFKDSHAVVSNLGDLPFEDENGDEPELDVTITQHDLEGVLGPIFQKAIDISIDLLSRNNIQGKDLAALILVGGPTYSPILRKMLKEQITPNVDTSIDPMTAVAKGAALFASTLDVTSESLDKIRDSSKLQFEIKFESTSVHEDEMVSIKYLRDKSLGVIPEQVFVEFIRADQAFVSNKSIVTEKPTLIDVKLEQGKSNSFTVNAYDELGNKIDCQPNQFNIIQGIGGLGTMAVLPYSIGIGRYFEHRDLTLFFPVKGLEKSKSLTKSGLTGVVNGLKTQKPIRPGNSTDAIRIPIYQGDYAASETNTELNNLVSEVVITGETIPALIAEGSDVDLTLKVNRSEKITVMAYFPSIDHTEEVEIQMAMPSAPTVQSLVDRILKAKKQARLHSSDSHYESLSELEDSLAEKGGSADGTFLVQSELRKILFELDKLEADATWPKIEEELKEGIYDFEEIIRQIRSNNDQEKVDFDAIMANISEMKSKAKQIIAAKDMKEAKELTAEIGALLFNLRNDLTGGRGDASYLKYYHESFDSHSWKDRQAARQLINHGMQIIASGKLAELRPVLVQVIQLLPENDKPGSDHLK